MMAAETGKIAAAEERAPASPSRLALKRLMAKPAALVALAVLGALIIRRHRSAAAGALRSAGDGHRPRPCTAGSRAPVRHRPVRPRCLQPVIYGGRISLSVAFAAVLISSLIGVVLGLTAGYYGRGPDMAIMRGMDILLAFPGIFLALAIVALLGPGLNNAVLAVAIAAIPTYTRTVRGCVLSAKENLYVDAARAIGVPGRRIVMRHLFPNVFAPVIILMTLGVAWAMLNISALSFLGLGSQPPTPEWGTMLYEGRIYLREAWWITTFPGLAIMITVMAVNRLGDGLRDALDPRLKI